MCFVDLGKGQDDEEGVNCEEVNGYKEGDKNEGEESCKGEGNENKEEDINEEEDIKEEFQVMICMRKQKLREWPRSCDVGYCWVSIVLGYRGRCEM